MPTLTPNNTPPLEVSQEDSDKIGRKSYDSYGMVTDINTGERYEIFGTDCNLEGCACAVIAIKDGRKE